MSGNPDAPPAAILTVTLFEGGEATLEAHGLTKTLAATALRYIADGLELSDRGDVIDSSNPAT